MGICNQGVGWGPVDGKGLKENVRVGCGQMRFLLKVGYGDKIAEGKVWRVICYVWRVILYGGWGMLAKLT